MPTDGSIRRCACLPPPCSRSSSASCVASTERNWQQNLSVAHGTDISKPLDAYGALKTMIDNWQSCFKDTFKQKTRTDVSKALDGRNAVSHTASEISAADAISYLTAIRGVAEAISAKAVVDGVKPLIDDQIKAAAKAMGVAPEIAVKTLTAPVAPQLDLGDGRYSWKPWRDVAPPHPDVMSARFVEAEFAADLSTVARDEGVDTYRDPREFFRITFMTGGLRKVLQSAIERLAGKGGDPVIGLQTSFGGGKTHTHPGALPSCQRQEPGDAAGPCRHLQGGRRRDATDALQAGCVRRHRGGSQPADRH